MQSTPIRIKNNNIRAMKTSTIFTLVAVASLVVGMASCTKSAQTKADGITFEDIRHEQTFRLAGSAADYMVDADLLYSCSAKLLMPRQIYGENADSLRRAIMKLAFDTVGTGDTALVEGAFRHVASELGYTPVDTVVEKDDYDGCFVVEGDVQAMSTSLLAYAVTLSTYSPHAAHGMYGTYYINYDMRGHTIFNLSDIITPEGLSELPGLLAKRAAAMRGYIGPTTLQQLPADGNFYVDNRANLVFVYQPYEIASYAQGIIEIPVPAYQIVDSLTPYGKRLLIDGDN